MKIRKVNEKGEHGAWKTVIGEGETPPFVTCKLTGRLGNNCIQIMTTIAHALRHNIEYKIPSFVKSKYTNKNPFDQFPLLTPEDEAKITLEHKYDGWKFIPIPYDKTHPYMRIHGYYQNLNYYDEYRAEIIKAFNLSEEVKRNECAIHIRLGDFKRYPDKWPVMPKEYFHEAVGRMKAEGVTKFTVFSDELQYAREYLPEGDYEFFYKDPLADWIEMGTYQHHIIPNSTFSYSAAYLKRSEGITIVPHEDKWYGPANKEIYNKEFLPDKWIKL